MRETMILIIPVAITLIIIVLTKQLRKELLEIQSIRQAQKNKDNTEFILTYKEKMWFIKTALIFVIGTPLFTITMLNALHIIFK